MTLSARPIPQETPEDDRRIYRPERCEYSNKDKDHNPKTLNDTIPIVVDAFETVFIGMERRPEKLEIRGTIDII